MNNSEETKEFLRRVYLKILDNAQSFLFIISFFLLLYMFVFRPHEVSGNSMFPTYKNHEILLSSLLDVRFHSLKHGDVIVFQSPVEEDKLYVKRIIGVEGDQIKLENGGVFLNGEKLNEEKYLEKTVMTYGGPFLPDHKEILVEKDTYFVMGDNRPNSSDSREWGLLPSNKIIGRSMIRIWPIQTFTFIQRNPYNH